MTALNKGMAQALGNGDYELTEDGVHFPNLGITASGKYFDRVNGGEWQESTNRIVKEGLIHILNVALGSKPKSEKYYLALFSGSATPEANWTAANFAANANEITSMSEGYTNPTRPEWNPTNATNDTFIDNMATIASVTIAATGSLNVNGCALLTTSTRGGTAGVLVSATKYPATRVLQNGDTFDIGYRLSLTV